MQVENDKLDVYINYDTCFIKLSIKVWMVTLKGTFVGNGNKCFPKKDI